MGTSVPALRQAHAYRRPSLSFPGHGPRRDPDCTSPSSGCLPSGHVGKVTLVVTLMEMNKDTQMRTSRGCFLGAGQSRESATVTRFWQRLESRGRSGRTHSRTEKAPGLPDWRPSAWGLEEGVLCVWSGGMSGSLVGPKLEGRTEIKEGGSYESSPGHSGPILQGLSFDFLGWLPPVKGVIHVYVQCLSLEETESWLPAASPQGLAGTVGVLARP